jgi:hypothetical protein
MAEKTKIIILFNRLKGARCGEFFVGGNFLYNF